MSTQLSKKEENRSMRFTNAVMLEVSKSSLEPAKVSDFQKKIIQNSFIKIDMILRDAEVARMKKSEAYRDSLPVTWDNVNMQQLAQDVAATSEVGLDPLQKNHINFVPYKNNSTGKYDLTPIVGYRGTELKALKFGLDIPNRIVVRLVFENEKFTPIFRDAQNEIEAYIHQPAPNPFDRGEIIGGYYYYDFDDKSKNRIAIMTINDILKRKPDYASVEFWGGAKDEWKNNKKTGNKIEVEGWFEEMCYKTVFRKAHEDITIDSEKISNSLARIIQLENSYLYGDDSATILLNAEASKDAVSKVVNIPIQEGVAIQMPDVEKYKKTASKKEVVDKETSEIQEEMKF